jgi:hypothetical protein
MQGRFSHRCPGLHAGRRRRRRWQAVTDKFIDRQPTAAQLKTFVDVLYTGPGQ